MGRQYVRQSFSSASSAAGDSPCASNTTLQCVVVNATPPCCPLASVAAVEVTSWGAALTGRWNQEIAPKASLHGDDATRPKILTRSAPIVFTDEKKPRSHSVCSACHRA